MDEADAMLVQSTTNLGSKRVNAINIHAMFEKLGNNAMGTSAMREADKHNAQPCFSNVGSKCLDSLQTNVGCLSIVDWFWHPQPVLLNFSYLILRSDR